MRKNCPIWKRRTIRLCRRISVIDEWMEADRKVPRKQRHTATRIYARLRDEKGYPGSYSSVKRYVRKKKLVMKLAAEGYLSLATTASPPPSLTA